MVSFKASWNSWYKICECMFSHFSCVWLFATLCTVVHQAHLSMRFSRQVYWSGLHTLLQGIFLTQGSNPCLLCLLYWQMGSLLLTPPRKPPIKYSSGQLLNHVWLFVTPWDAPCQASLSIINSRNLLKLMYIGPVMPSNHLILYCLPLLPSIFPSIIVFSNESVLHIR